jgi:superfamily II DNA helicase RecQ
MNFKTALGEIVKNHNSFTLLTAPMGWGKTRLIWELLEENKKIILICPLRSILDELSSRTDVIVIDGGNRDRAIRKFVESERAILLTTVEQFPWEVVESLIEEFDPLFALDEFHLFYKWGGDFRPHLYELFRFLILSKARSLGVTATLPLEVEQELQKDLSLNDKKAYYVNLGNFQLRYDPKKQVKFKRELMDEIFLYHCRAFRKGRILIFVKTRKEAKEIKYKLLKLGIDCSICLGGEVRDFVSEEYILKKKVVIATSALSHGVNLENIRKIFLTYEPPEYLKLQMIGRGGRFGEAFKVYELANKLGRSSLVDRLKYKVNMSLYQTLNQALELVA